MVSPEREIINALKLDNPSALSKVLPKIRASPREDELIELILYETASNGYLKSYQLVAEQVFRHAVDVKSSMRIPPAIRASIRKGHRAVADDLVARILDMAQPEPRRFLMVCAFHCAVAADDTAIVERILREEILYAEFQKAMSGAAESCSMEVMTLLLDGLLDDEKTRSRAPWIQSKTEEEIQHNVHLLQAQCLMTALCSAIGAGAHEVAAFLLQPYLECLEDISPVSHENFNKTEIFTGLDDEVYLLLGREECKKLLAAGVPVFAGRRIDRCLKMDIMP
ncbi:hypothetical protein ASPCAL10050 [Aspergillus calidoustus]|uniref:Uncharacterized protein n=1 Tax=Aspergillus calidoustus TaxID=454130 RepID=A0A0U5G4P5_ASPCI|nr:hypothetical protein ASPCAL10050 [Aspergillus calidoustus]